MPIDTEQESSVRQSNLAQESAINIQEVGIRSTSLNAHHEVKQTLGLRQGAVLAVLSFPRTNSEIAKELGWAINRVTPRTNELVKMRLVRAAYRRKCLVTGSMAIVWRKTTEEERRLKEEQLTIGI